ncbi:hypothetical protein C1H46_013291 [Malus baccata]|uniref:Olee1-like protein n=1 Tax=Malus baccata TaxID=106549 RepID=A0A540MQC8_MALBA|nr:hypothetical protein C1H46_013291 [Malus baccata]
MANSNSIVLVSALCFLSLAGVAYCGETLNVHGIVYCDNCRIQFVTRISETLKGAQVRLECRENEGGKITLSKEADTDDLGTYSIPVEGDHEEEVCEVILVKSPNEDCSEISNELHVKLSARISLTNHNGITGPHRMANPLGFMKKEVDPKCAEVLKELGLTPDGDIDDSGAE